jgi:hypothetical protein
VKRADFIAEADTKKGSVSASPRSLHHVVVRELALPLLVLRVALVDDEYLALAPHDDVVRAALLDGCGYLHAIPPGE